MTNKVNRRKSLGSSKILFTIISILLGLLVGALVLVIAGFDPIEGFKNLFLGVFKSPRNMGWAIVTSTPIILTGLGVAFAFKTGLFNMGAEGQFIIGTIVAFLVGYNLNLPPVILPIVAIVLAMVIGAIYGAIAGFIKAKFGIHEVISTIMLNWIAFYFQNFIVYRFRQPNSMSSFDVADKAKITLFTDAAKRFDGFFSKFFRAPIHWGTIIAIVAVIVVWYILNKTTLGYELKAVGLNREASEYGGINAGNKIIQSMAISASNNPIGVIFSGLFFGSLKYAGGNLQRTMGVPSEIISIIIGTIILFTAVPLVFRIIKAKIRKKNSKKKNEKTAVDMSYVNKEIEEKKEEL